MAESINGQSIPKKKIHKQSFEYIALCKVSVCVCVLRIPVHSIASKFCVCVSIVGVLLCDVDNENDTNSM